jgi:hypothetical protein
MLKSQPIILILERLTIEPMKHPTKIWIKRKKKGKLIFLNVSICPFWLSVKLTSARREH